MVEATEETTQTDQEKVCQIAIPTKFKLYKGKTSSRAYRKFSEFCDRVEEAMGGVRFMSTTGMVGEYGRSRHLFYIVSSKDAEHVRQGLLDVGLAEEVYIDQI